MLETIQQVDLSILDWIQTNLRCGFLDAVMKYITLLGEHGLFPIAVAIILLFFRSKRRAGAAILGGLGAGYLVVNTLIKNIVARPRPFTVNTAVQLIVSVPGEPYSFPSGHAFHGFLFATVLMCYDKRLGVPALILEVLIAFSRLYLYVHYPSDVLCGIIFGILFGLLAVFVTNKIADKLEKRKAKSQ